MSQANHDGFSLSAAHVQALQAVIDGSRRSWVFSLLVSSV